MFRGNLAINGPVGEAYRTARLRWATVGDGPRLQRLFERACPQAAPAPSVPDWLEQGGAVLLEDATGQVLCAVSWRENAEGWRLEPIATLEEARGLGFGRWLMTKVEALAIKYNVPSLSVVLPDEELLGYYRRLGYTRVEDAEGITVHKRVGGRWQMQEPAKR